MKLLASLATVIGLTACIADVPTEAELAYPDDGEGEAPETETLAATRKKQLAYVVIPHPDDEWEAWSLIEKSADNYPVFMLMTRGEETSACVPSIGPTWYQGNLGEYRHGNPYQGKWNPACSAARLASFHLFLDRMAQVDPTLPYKPPYVGRFCFAGDATRVDNGVTRSSGCADVWASNKGARVIFDLGDNDLRASEVLWAIQQVRANKAMLKIPALREHEILGAAFYNATAPGSGVPAYSNCDYYGHGDHHAIHSALWDTNVGAGPQLVRACDTDPDVAATNGRVDVVDADMDKAAFEVDASGQRKGASTVAYGWLNPVVYESCYSGCGFSRKQSFWRR